MQSAQLWLAILGPAMLVEIIKESQNYHKPSSECDPKRTSRNVSASGSW